MLLPGWLAPSSLSPLEVLLSAGAWLKGSIPGVLENEAKAIELFRLSE